MIPLPKIVDHFINVLYFHDLFLYNDIYTMQSELVFQPVPDKKLYTSRNIVVQKKIEKGGKL